MGSAACERCLCHRASLRLFFREKALALELFFRRTPHLRPCAQGKLQESGISPTPSLLIQRIYPLPGVYTVQGILQSLLVSAALSLPRKFCHCDAPQVGIPFPLNTAP